MSGSKTLLSKNYGNKFIDMNTLSTYKIDHVFSWDFQTVTDRFLHVLPNCISNLINDYTHFL